MPRTHLCLGQTEESAVAEHILNTGYEIQFEKTHRLNKTTYMDQIVKEAIETYLHAYNFNREAGFILRCTWRPVTSLLKCSPQPGIENPGQVQ